MGRMEGEDEGRWTNLHLLRQEVNRRVLKVMNKEGAAVFRDRNRGYQWLPGGVGAGEGQRDKRLVSL